MSIVEMFMMKPMTLFDSEHPDEEPSQIMPDGRFSHIMQVQERLRFLRYTEITSI